MKLSWGIITMGAVSNLFGFVDLLNSTGLVLYIFQNPGVSILTGLTTSLVTFFLGIVITTSGILTFRLHPWATPFAIIWAAIVTSSIVLNQGLEVWELWNLEHQEGIRIPWGKMIAGIIGGLAYPLVLIIFYSRPSTRQYFTNKAVKDLGKKPMFTFTRILRWKPAIWIVGIFSILWLMGQGIVYAALMLFLVILLFALFDIISSPEPT